MAMLKIMGKPKKAPQREQVVGEMDLDKIVASPYQMAMAAKEEAKEVAKKTNKYRASANKAINSFTGSMKMK